MEKVKQPLLTVKELKVNISSFEERLLSLISEFEVNNHISILEVGLNKQTEMKHRCPAKPYWTYTHDVKLKIELK